MQMNTSPPSDIQVIEKIGFLKRYQAAFSDRLSLSVSKDGGEVLTPELTKLTVFTGQGRIFKDRCESVIAPIYKKVTDPHAKTTEELI